MNYKLRPEWTIDMKQDGRARSTITLKHKNRVIAVFHLAHKSDQDPVSLIVSNFSAAFEIVD